VIMSLIRPDPPTCSNASKRPLSSDSTWSLFCAVVPGFSSARGLAAACEHLLAARSMPVRDYRSCAGAWADGEAW
jgi:hypothetical protein